MPRWTKENNDMGVAGWVQTTLPDVPAEFLFDKLRDMQFYRDAVPDILSVKPYDPIEQIHRKKTSLPLRYPNGKTAMNNSIHNGNSLGLAQGGHCYVQKRKLEGKIACIRSQYTQVDKEFDADNKRTFITHCDFWDLTVTSTHVVERLGPPGKVCSDQPDKSIQTSHTICSSSTTTSSGSESGIVDYVEKEVIPVTGCRWTLSYALIPSGWSGKFYMWRNRWALPKVMQKLHSEEVSSIQKATRDRYYENPLLSSPAPVRDFLTSKTRSSRNVETPVAAKKQPMMVM